jgi:hypothetical protein
LLEQNEIHAVIDRAYSRKPGVRHLPEHALQGGKY